MDSIDQSVDRSYESQSIPGPSKQSGYPLPGERVNPLEEVLSSEDAWEQRNILSLDGGGVRGIWSLMALEKLMEWIAIEEIEQSGSDTPVQHSFHPEPFPGHVSHGPFDKGGDGRHPEKASEYETWKESRKYLPCHYFDIIGGSSTGALIAIMLGRFRMSVPDCLHEYKTLAGQIFEKPRLLPITMTIVTNRPVRSKYNCNTIEKIFQNVAKRRERMFEDELDHHEQRFRSEKGVCGTFVTSFRKAPAAPHRSAAESKLVIIRSYDNTRRGRTLKSQADSQGQPHRLPGPKSPALQRSDTTGLSRQARHQQREGRPNIAGTSYRWQVWEVARAATAADFFFDPFEIEGQDSREKVIYTDAGLDHNNNPVREAVEEIEDLAGPNSLGIVVSVGTARGQKKSKMTISAKLKSMIDEKTDPEVNHRWAEDKFEVKSGHHRHYFRLNHPGALEIELDEWLPRKHWYNRPERAAGSDTVEKIRNKFNEWAGSAESTRQLRECAEKLVRRRRARASKPTLGKWEHFATCIKINCYGRRCNETFRNRDDFMRHIQDGQMHPDEKDESKEEIDWRLKEYGWTTRWIYQAPR